MVEKREGEERRKGNFKVTSIKKNNKKLCISIIYF
jgi:hypothetical protein